MPSSSSIHGDAAPGAFSAGNDLLRYYAIYMAGEACFFAREFLEPAIRRRGVFRLQLAAQTAVPVANALELAAAIAFPVGIECDSRDSEIYAQKDAGGIGGRLCDLAGGSKVEGFIVEDQIRLHAAVRDERPSGKVWKLSAIEQCAA